MTGPKGNTPTANSLYHAMSGDGGVSPQERTFYVNPCMAFMDDVQDALNLHVTHRWNAISHEAQQHVRLVTLVLEETSSSLQFQFMAQVTIHELQGLIDGNNYGMNISIGIRTGIHFVHTPEIRVGEGTTELSELRMHRSHLMIKDNQFHLVFQKVHHLFEGNKTFPT